MGSKSSRIKKKTQLAVESYINFIKKNYSNDWATLYNRYSLADIKAKCESLYLNQADTTKYFDHTKYTCFSLGYYSWSLNYRR